MWLQRWHEPLLSPLLSQGLHPVGGRQENHRGRSFSAYVGQASLWALITFVIVVADAVTIYNVYISGLMYKKTKKTLQTIQ